MARFRKTIYVDIEITKNEECMVLKEGQEARRKIPQE